MKLLQQFNNSQVIGVATQKQVKDISHADARWIRNMDFKENKKSLGLLNLFEQAQIVKVPFLRDVMKNSDYLYVNGMEGSFTYDIMMDAEYPTVVQNIEDGGEYLGLDGIPFQMKISHPFRQGDILTYDAMDGVQVQVAEDSDVVDTGDGFIHTVFLNNKDRAAYFPASKLVPGTRIFKIGSVLGEYSTQFSGITGGGTPSKVTLEYRIGSPQGVEVSYTAFGASINIEGSENSYITEHLLRKAHTIGDTGLNEKGEYLVYGTKTADGKIKVNKIEKLMNALAMAELYKMTASRMMFSHANTTTGINGSKRVNEGIYPQLRRGHRFTYRNEVELRAMIRQAADVVYSGTSIPVEQREIKFKAGKRAYDLVRQMFKEEFTSTFPAFLDQKAIPVPLLSGSDRHNLTYETITIGKAFLNGIGIVEVEHDPSLDYDFGDIVIRGYTGGLSKRSWSMVMWDVTDPMYSNVYDKSLLPKGVEVDQRAKGKNLYIVKPSGVPDVSFGTETGRMPGQNVRSIGGHMGETFWAYSQLDAWIPDLSRVVLIEREDAFTEDGYKYL
jgi:hypothetical protein